MTTYANLDAHEGAVTGSTILDLTRRSRRLIITNDESAADLRFKFNASENYATLKPTETISMQINVNQVYLQGSGAYRIWNYG